MTKYSSNYPFDNGNEFDSSPRIPEEILRQHAQEWLGPERSFEDLPIWEQRLLLAEIEEDLMELQLIPVKSTYPH